MAREHKKKSIIARTAILYYSHLFVFVVMLMGFTETEARLGLRACHGDSTLAVDYITQRRQVKNAFLSARHAIFPYEKERVLKA